MDVFSSREIALGIWLLVLATFILSKHKTREPLLNAARILLGVKLLIPIILMGCYTFVIAFILKKVGLWNASLLKDTILWYLFSGVALAFNTASQKSKSNIFIEIFVDNVKAIIVLEFIVNVYSFPLIIEIALVPIFVFIALCEVIVERDPKLATFGKVLKFFVASFGWAVLIYSAYMIATHIKDVGNLDTLRSFLLAPLLAIFFIPFVYLLTLYMNYEQVFVRIDFNNNTDKKFRRVVKWKVFLFCNFRYSRVMTALDKPYRLFQLKNMKDVDNLILSWKTGDHNTETQAYEDEIEDAHKQEGKVQ